MIAGTQNVLNSLSCLNTFMSVAPNDSIFSVASIKISFVIHLARDPIVNFCATWARYAKEIISAIGNQISSSFVILPSKIHFFLNI